MPFRFGSPARELYGVLHAPQMEKSRGQAILLCNPLGQEAVRVHRLYRVLAERLAKEGCNVLRFDYYGTGESGGEDIEASLAGWQADIISADSELRRRSGARSYAWVGARLGGSIAALASTKADAPPDALVLWEPIADGATYTREQFAPAYAPALDVPHSALPSDRSYLLDVQGFAVTRDFMDDVSTIRRDAVWHARASRIALLASETTCRRWCDAPGHDPDMAPSIEFESGIDPFEWCAEEAMDSEVVPRKVVARLMGQLLR